MRVVLIVEDERGVRDALVKAVTQSGHRAIGAQGLAAARERLATEDVGCVLLDVRLRDGDGLALLGEIRQGERRDVPVIIATAYGDSERTIQAMRDGAFEYLTKPFDLPLLLATVERAMRQQELTRSVRADASPVATRGGLIGSSEAMLAVWKMIGRAAGTDAPVLITGETGTGKELVARAIHDYSARAKEPFVGVNLAAVPPTLIESELMGHEKGSFTGATSRRAGRFEAAGAGTLFLDEIGDLDVTLQTKMLRVLQEGTFERVGGNQLIPARARILAATSKPVRPGETGSSLRDDLFYRLAVIAIHVPPLRERRSDIPLLVAHALQGTKARAVTEGTMAYLMAYNWPGNVRELVHVVRRAGVMCGGDVIDVPDLPTGVTSSAPPQQAEEKAELENLSLRDALAAVERRLILAALERSAGNRSEAARRLGIGRTNLYDKLEEHGIASDEKGPPSK